MDELPAAPALSRRERAELLAGAWYEVLAPTSFVPFTAAEVRRRLAQAAELALALVEGSPFPPEEARPIGAALADLHFLQPEVLGKTLHLLFRHLLPDLAGDRIAALQPRLAALMEGVAAGYVQRASQVQLAEQTAIRDALLTELGSAQQALREAHDGLEEQVEQRTAELRLLEERWRLLVTQAPDLVLAVDAAGRIVFANRTPTGSVLTLAQVPGRLAWDLFWPDHRDTARAAVRRVFATSEPTRYEVAVRRPAPEETVTWYAVNVGPLIQDGRVAAAILVARDVTERKLLEEARNELIGDFSHDLRGPLTAIQLTLEALLKRLEREPGDRQDLAEYGRIALGSAQRLSQTVSATLDPARLAAGAGSLHLRPLQLDDLIRAAVQDMAPLAEARGLSLVAPPSAPQPLPPLGGDRDQLFRLLLNLIDNAVKFTPSGRVTISAEATDHEVQVRVSDTGQGICPENLGRIFERSFQEGRGSGGAGMGLTICRAIVEAHGGRIWAESPGRGGGATLSFTLPIAAGP